MDPRIINAPTRELPESERLLIQEAELAKLTHAKRLHKSWMESARAFVKGREAAGKSASKFEDMAAARSGYSEGMLRRYEVVLDFVESRIPEHERPPIDVLEASFTVLEKIARLDRLRPQQTKSWLGRLGRRDCRVVDLDQALEEARTAPLGADGQMDDKDARRSHAALERRDRLARSMKAISENLGSLKGCRLVQPGGLNESPLRCEAIAFPADADGMADGYDFVFAPGTLPFNMFADRVCRAAASAVFVRNFYLVFSDDSDPAWLGRAGDMLEYMGAKTVGLVVVGEDGAVDVLKIPRGYPEPDHTHLLQTFYRRGRWQAKDDESVDLDTAVAFNR